MKQGRREQRVFVVAPGPVVLFFPKIKKLLADLKRIPIDERDAAKFYSVDGEILTLVGTPRNGFHLGSTGEFDVEGLRAALASIADDSTADTEPRAVAAQLASRRRWACYRERELRRREDRAYYNSAVLGLGVMALGLANFAIVILTKSPAGNYVLPLIVTLSGWVKVWPGIKRWRRGEEFNLPGKPGPLRRPPPPERRGD